MSKISDIRKIIIQYIASGNIDPDNDKEVERFSELIRQLELRST